MLDEKEQKRELKMYAIEQAEHMKLINDPLLLSLAEIKELDEQAEQCDDRKEKEYLSKLVHLLLQGTSIHRGDSQVILKMVSKRIHKQMGESTIKEFMNDSNSMFADFAGELKEKSSFNDMCKNSTQAAVQANNTDNYMMRYFEECTKKNVQALPILFKIKDGILKLTEYTLNDGVCSSFAEAVNWYPDIIHSISLSRNGLKDK